TVTLTVNEVNATPMLGGVPSSANVDEGSTLTFTATFSDTDVPPNTPTFSLVNAPDGATINPATGAFSWTPNESQGPGTYTFTVKVTDNGSPPQSDQMAIPVTVNEVNLAPVLSGVPTDVTIPEMAAYNFTATATDDDIPAQDLTFSLVGA